MANHPFGRKPVGSNPVGWIPLGRNEVGRKAALCAAALTLLAACDDDDGGSSSGTNVPVNPTSGFTSVYVGQDAGAGGGRVLRTTHAFQTEATYSTGADQGLALDYLGDLFQVGDGANGPTLRVFARARSRPDFARFDGADIERELRGNNTTFVEPKGVHIANRAGLVLVADFGASAVVVFGTTAAGDVPPLARAELAVAPWDLALDEERDRLFLALTNGTIGVIDDFVARGFSGVLSRVIVPDVDGTVARNLHGIALDVDGDRLVVSDIGEPGVADDGALYVLEHASRAAGRTAPSRHIAGRNTLLGDPVDIALDGSRLRVAERTNGGGRLLVFAQIFQGAASDVAPSFARPFRMPESLAIEPAVPSVPREASDLVGPSVELARVLTTRNDPGNVVPEDLRRHDLDSLEVTDTFRTPFGLESLDLDVRGDVYVSFDDGSTGGILVLNRAATSREGGEAQASRDRVMHCVGLVAPKGIEVVEARGIVLVAETTGVSSPGILGYSTEAYAFGVGAEPILSIPLPSAPWDLDYDEATDRLFVASTDGTVAVLDDLLEGAMTPIAPDRTFAIAAPRAPGSRRSENLHGIVYDSERDRLIVSDIGRAAGPGAAEDGRIFVVDDASSASGLVVATVHVEGPRTRLGNPVDLAFDGRDLYVAEKAHAGGELLRFAGFAALDTTTSTDVPPSSHAPAPDVESVALTTLDLAPVGGGSLGSR